MMRICKNNKIVIIGLVIILVLGVMLVIFFKNKSSNKDIIQDRQTVLRIDNFNIEGRTTFKLEDNIYIGNNLKELENGFYDIRIQNIDYGICMYLNKLWHETYGEDYIQNDYLAQICRELTSRLNITNNTEEFEYMVYKYIKDNYIRVRENQVVESIEIYNLIVGFEIQDNIVKLIIRGR